MKVILISLGLALMFMFSCRVKEACELNHTGTIVVTNNTANSMEVFVENTKVFDLAAGESKSTDQAVGTYTVKCLSFPDEWSNEAIVTECDDIEISIPE
jgi:hypothetical protein